MSKTLLIPDWLQRCHAAARHAAAKDAARLLDKNGPDGGRLFRMTAARALEPDFLPTQNKSELDCDCAQVITALSAGASLRALTIDIWNIMMHLPASSAGGRSKRPAITVPAVHAACVQTYGTLGCGYIRRWPILVQHHGRPEAADGTTLMFTANAWIFEISSTAAYCIVSRVRRQCLDSGAA